MDERSEGAPRVIADVDAKNLAAYISRNVARRAAADSHLDFFSPGHGSRSGQTRDESSAQRQCCAARPRVLR
jgi:hypothetical protein